MIILSMNLKAYDHVPFEDRVSPLATWVGVKNPDVVCLQEVVTGFLAPRFNSATYLAKMSGHDYHVTTAPMSFPLARPVISHAIGILSKEKPLVVLSSNLNTFKTAAGWNEKYLWSWGARALAVLLPTWAGDVWFVTVHADGTQGADGWCRQAQGMNALLADCIAYTPVQPRFILGGDWNFGPTGSEGDNALREYLEVVRGFRRAYTGCTVGQIENPYGGSGVWKAPDHIYMSRQFIATREYVICNNPGSFVSDHAGVVSELWKPGER
jgi:endonuclease/exonuclease/phosphatase family metal-dependent hydrolase